MMRSIFAMALLTVAGSSWADSRIIGGGNIRGATSTFLVGDSDFPRGISGGTAAFLAGNITQGFNRNRNGFNGFAIQLTDDTPFAFFGETSQKMFDAFYDILLPTYEALDGPAMKLAAFGTPLTDPLAETILILSGTFASALTGNTSSSGASIGAGVFSALPGLPNR